MSHAAWFFLLSLGWSGYQAFVGWQYGLYINDTLDRPRAGAWRHAVYGAHHAMLYFACSVAGFVSLALASAFVTHVENWASLSGGAVTLLIALGALGVLGVSGALARLVYLGQRLW